MGAWGYSDTENDTIQDWLAHYRTDDNLNEDKLVKDVNRKKLDVEEVRAAFLVCSASFKKQIKPKVLKKALHATQYEIEHFVDDLDWRFPSQRIAYLKSIARSLENAIKPRRSSQKKPLRRSKRSKRTTRSKRSSSSR